MHSKMGLSSKPEVTDWIHYDNPNNYLDTHFKRVGSYMRLCMTVPFKIFNEIPFKQNDVPSGYRICEEYFNLPIRWYIVNRSGDNTYFSCLVPILGWK